MRGARGALASALLPLACAGVSLAARAGPAPAATPGLAWIYVEANTGGSSGGHVALRVDDTIYHIQQVPDGLYALQRDEWPTFRHIYAGLQNRTLHAAALDVSEPDVERVRLQLARAYVAQQDALRRVERLALDRAWLEAWRAGVAPPPLAAAGLLAPDTAPGAPAAALRAHVEDTLGAGSLAGARAETARRLAAFEPGRDDLETLRETLQLDTALRALDERWSVAPEARLPIPAALDEPLREAERAGSLRFAAHERSSVVELLRSERPDRGRALLLAIARHHALAESAASGRLVLLDAYAGEATFLPEPERPRPESLARLAAELAPVVRKGRGTVLGREAFDEAQYNLLEVAAAVVREYERGAAGGPVRKLPRRALPAAPGALPFAPARASAAQLGAAAASVAHARAEEEARVRAAYHYEVLDRNCVTELARLVNEAFAEDDVARALGASLTPGASLTFIPFAFFDAVTEHLRVAHVETIPSYRTRELARLEREEPSALLGLREAVTLSSSIYTPRLRDSSFLFFTDDVALRRPLLGLANLFYAGGRSLYGLAAAPFDGAKRLRAAGAGAWYSLPELAFFNIRKGTFDWVPEEPAQE